jgi:hypothetical protein
MKTKRIAYLFMLVMILVLVGCTRVDDHIIVNEDGRALREIIVTVDKTDPKFSKLNAGITIRKAEKLFKDKGYHVERIEDDEKVIKLRFTKKIEGVDKDYLSILFNEENEQPTDNEVLTVSKVRNFFFATYKSKNDVSLEYLKTEFGENGIDYRLYITFPEKVHGKHNAVVMKDGKTLAWKLPLGKEQQISLDIYTINYSHIMMVGIPIVGILFIALYLIITNKEKNPPVQRRIPMKERN